MSSTYRVDELDPDFEIWAELTWVIGQWLCDPARGHNRFPGPYNGACDSCYEEAHYLVHDGLQEILKVYGAVLYLCGRVALPKGEAARRALEAMVARAWAL